MQAAALSDLGAEPTEHYRALAALPSTDVDEIIEELVIDSEMGGVALTKFQAAKLRTFFRGARVAAGVQKSTEEERQADTKKLEKEPAQPLTTAKNARRRDRRRHTQWHGISVRLDCHEAVGRGHHPQAI